MFTLRSTASGFGDTLSFDLPFGVAHSCKALEDWKKSSTYQVISDAYSARQVKAVLHDYVHLVRRWFFETVHAAAKLQGNAPNAMVDISNDSKAFAFDPFAKSTLDQRKAWSARLAELDVATGSKSEVKQRDAELEILHAKMETDGLLGDYVKALLYFSHYVLDAAHDRMIREHYATNRLNNCEEGYLTWSHFNVMVLHSKNPDNVLGTLAQVLNYQRSEKLAAWIS